MLSVSSPYTFTPYIANKSQNLRQRKTIQSLFHVVFDPDFLKHVICLNYNTNWNLWIFSRVTSERGAALHWSGEMTGKGVIHSFSGIDGLFLAPLGKSSTDPLNSKTFHYLMSTCDWLNPLTLRISGEDAGETYISVTAICLTPAKVYQTPYSCHEHWDWYITCELVWNGGVSEKKRVDSIAIIFISVGADVPRRLQINALE